MDAGNAQVFSGPFHKIEPEDERTPPGLDLHSDP